MIDRPLYVDKIMAYVDTPFVKILTGVRRCGKSTILKMIMERLKTERNIPVVSYHRKASLQSACGREEVRRNPEALQFSV